MELRIDVQELLKRVLDEVGPDEDIDEAILRVCKQRYPDHFMDIFPGLLQVLELEGKNKDGSGIDRIRDLVDPANTLTINLHTSDVTETKVIDGNAGKIMKDLPAGLRKKFGSLLDGDAGMQEIEKTIVRRTSSSGREMLDCRCGFLGPVEDDRCPKCGRKI